MYLTVEVALSPASGHPAKATIKLVELGVSGFLVDVSGGSLPGPHGKFPLVRVTLPAEVPHRVSQAGLKSLVKQFTTKCNIHRLFPNKNPTDLPWNLTHARPDKMPKVSCRQSH